MFSEVHSLERFSDGPGTYEPDYRRPLAWMKEYPMLEIPQRTIRIITRIVWM